MTLKLRTEPRRFLITGVAGFIGSHLLEHLLRAGQDVVGIDNFSTGARSNLEAVKAAVGDGPWSHFRLFEGDVGDAEVVQAAIPGVQVVLHQAALGSVPRSLENPVESTRVNVGGMVCVLEAARRFGVRRFVYASSSSVYGDSLSSPKRETDVGQPLSPYAATKQFNEVHADLFQRMYGLSCIGLRYFNVFGPRQDPRGDYAAVIPRWISARLSGQPCAIFGDGFTSRDFCYIDNVVQANLLAALHPGPSAARVYNVALGDEITLRELYDLIDGEVCRGSESARRPPDFRDFRVGDVRNSRADISRIVSEFGFQPAVRVREGVALTVAAFRQASAA